MTPDEITGIDKELLAARYADDDITFRIISGGS
jgi:hypothetical protein